MIGALTVNDRRVLTSIGRATEHYDGYMPHGAADWTAIWRLEKANLVLVLSEWADCQTCTITHEGPAYTLTIWGRREIAETGSGVQP